MLEQLYPVKLIEKNPFYAFLLGAAYAVIGIGLAVLLFPEDPALVAVALISLMFYPTINKLMKQEENIEAQKREINPFVFLRDHKYIFVTYLLFFVGVLLIFALFAIMLPSLATNHIFENQINVMYGPTGKAIFDKGLFSDLFTNNIIVLIVIFVTAFVLGEGGIFLITWNASVWGTIFGNLAKSAAVNMNKDPFMYFGLVLAIVFPHMILEAFAYVVSATTGGVVSKATIKEKLFSKKFNYIVINTIISFAFALFILLIAVSIETYVLKNIGTYQQIIRQSFM